MKRLVCSLDGTWNDDDGGAPLTNVAKLHRAILPRDAAGVRQYVRYVVGISSAEDERAAFLRGAIGLEVGDRIRFAYEYLCDRYEPGDEIYLFGFSRGAYEARSLASFITLFGLARPSGKFSIDEAWSLYRQPEHERDINAVARLSLACRYPVRIRCIGVWDTVGNIGIPFSPRAWLSRHAAYHDMRLHDTIDVALHALSIDEERGPFRPTLFTLPEETPLAPHQYVEQAWFAGTHADVGGGWPETELSDIALLWMAERAEAAGLAIDRDALASAATPDPLGLQHYSATGKLYAFTRLVPFLRLIDQNLDGIPPGRRRWLKTARTGKLPDGFVSLNESVHASALERLGQTVREAVDNETRRIRYLPQNLIAATDGEIPEDRTPPESTPEAPPEALEVAEEEISARPEPLPAEEAAMPGPVAATATDDARGPAFVPSEEARPASPIKFDQTQRDEPPAVAATTRDDTIARLKGAEMSDESPVMPTGDPGRPDQPASMSEPPPKVKVVTVHGTGAGLTEDAGQSWWQKDSAFQKKISEIVEIEGDNIEVVPFHWGTGPNSETSRREAGNNLYELLRGYDAQGIDYYLIGHSHGGSVIYNALLCSVAKKEPLERLKTWFTVATPFLDFKPSFSLFSRVNIWGQIVYVTAVGVLLLALGLLASKFFDFHFAETVKTALGDKADKVFYVPILSLMFGYVAFCYALLFMLEWLTRRWYSDRQKAKARDLYEAKWVGLWHHDDEAISALTDVRLLDRPIVPTNFLVPVFSFIPLVLTIVGVAYLLYAVIHSASGDSEWVRTLFDKLGAATANVSAGWDGQSVASILHDLATIIVFIAAPVLGAYLLATTIGIGLFRLFAYLIGIPLAKAIDKLVWSSLRQETWGNDRRGESVRAVSSHPPLFTPRYVPLPAGVADRLASFSEAHAIETYHRARALLGLKATTPSAGDIGRDLNAQLSWEGLIHTSYFEIEEFIALLAAALRQAGVRAAVTGRGSAANDDLVQQWLRDIAAAPATSMA